MKNEILIRNILMRNFNRFPNFDIKVSEKHIILQNLKQVEEED